MTYAELLAKARTSIGSYCKACPVCDGRACGNAVPGPGAKGTGTVAIRNYNAWQSIFLNMDTLCADAPIDTKVRLFGREFSLPVFAGPVGAVNLHYGEKYDDLAYNRILISACAKEGIAAFTGDGTNPEVVRAATAAIAEAQGTGIPTIKPWDSATVREKMEMVRKSGAFAAAMDIDAAGLPFLKGLNPPAGRKSAEELAEIIRDAGVPFIVKGVMTAKAAEKAADAGAAAVIVSNHGGRVLDHCPATADVLPEIVSAVGERVRILVDGGIRTGADVFKALALGADAVVIARPFVTAVYGGGEEGVRVYTEKLASELRDTMFMCGADTIGSICPEMVRR